MSAELKAKLAAGATAGFSSALDYERERPVREMRQAEARMKMEQAQRDNELGRKMQPAKEAEVEAAIYGAREEAYKARRNFLGMRTYDAFRNYTTDYDTRHLNNFLQFAKNEPLSAGIFSSVARVDSLEASDKDQVRRLLTQAGYADPDAVLNSDELRKNFLMATDNKGDLTLLSVPQLFAATGYSREMDRQKLLEMEERVKLEKLMQGPRSAETQMIHDIAAALKEQGYEGDVLMEAMRRYTKMKKGGSAGGSATERVANHLMETYPDKYTTLEEALVDAKQILAPGSANEREAMRIAKEKGISIQDAYEQVTARTERTSTEKNADAAFEVYDTLDSIGGGSFFKLDLSNVDNRRKAGKYITQLEQLTGKKLSTEDVRLARNIRDLTKLGGEAGTDLGTEETGLMDSILGDAKKYVIENGGKEGAAAYETFRNVIRNSLYGASLTNSEITSFNSAAGTLKQKLGPVLEQLKVQMQSIKNQLSAIYDFNDEYIAYYYVGKDREELDRVISALDQRINMISQRASNEAGKRKVPPKPPAPPKAPVRSEQEDFDLLRGLREEGN